MTGMKALSGVVGTTGLGVAMTLASWPAVAAVAVPTLALSLIACWILASAARTSRLTRIIRALRSDRRRETPAVSAAKETTVRKGFADR
jgi:hypothetical protein